MENILKKALAEVLTPQYSEELRDSYDTGYEFSDKFESEMKELIRKTDRPPIYRYRGWIAAAACAVLAVGSAVLIPTLTDNRINVDRSVESSASVTETTPVETAVDSDSVQTSATGDSSDAIPPLTTGTASSSSETTDRPVLEESEENEYDNGSDSETVTADSDIAEDEKEDDAAVVDNGSADVKPDDNNSSESEKETVTDEPGGETYNVKVSAGTKLSEVFSDNFDISFDDMWAKYAEYCPDGVYRYGRYSSINCSNAEYAFLQEFVHSLGDAESLEDGFGIDEGKAYINISINASKPHINNTVFGNTSSWKYYDQFFNVNEDESDDTVYEEYETGVIATEEFNTTGTVSYYPAFKVTIYKNSGCMMFSYIEYYNDQTKKTDLYMLGYYRMDKADVDKLFRTFEKMYLSDEPDTVSGFADDLGITAENIASAYADIDYIYDTDIFGAKLKPEYVESFFKKHGAKKLDNTQYTVTGEDGNIYTYEKDIRNWCGGFTVMLKNDASIRVKLSTDGKCVLTDGIKILYFDITLDDIKEVMKAAGDANGFEIPFWSTLGEYLEGKSFNELRYAETYGVIKDDKKYMVTVTDEETLKTLHDMIVSAAPEAEYLPNNRKNTGYEVSIGVKGYNNTIFLRSNDTSFIRTFTTNAFKMPDGFNERFISVITSCVSAKWEEEETETDDNEYPDEPVSLDEVEAVDD